MLFKIFRKCPNGISGSPQETLDEVPDGIMDAFSKEFLNDIFCKEDSLKNRFAIFYGFFGEIWYYFMMEFLKDCLEEFLNDSLVVSLNSWKNLPRLKKFKKICQLIPTETWMQFLNEFPKISWGNI